MISDLRSLIPGILLLFSLHTGAQIPDAVYAPNIKSVQLFPAGNQLGYPILGTAGNSQLELHFDDLDANVKNYSYTFQLCDADWKPSMLSSFDFIKGFSQQRITNYRISSIAYTRYTHYQAILPDQNCMPTRAGNYILKVFLNSDTSKLILTKRMMILMSEKATIPVQIQQAYNGQIFRTHQKVQFKINLSQQLNVVNQFQQIKVVILQNGRWDNAVTELRPTFFTRNSLEYNTENDAVFPAGKEWRWLDLRSLRFQSDRVEKVNYSTKSTEVFVKADADRSAQRFNFFRDNNGKFTIETTESVNPFWQADYATVTFSYIPPDNVPFVNQDIYLFGQLTNYDLGDTAKMVFNNERRVYEKKLFLKTGYYDYCYVTVDRNAKKKTASFEFTEGNYWESENDYIILVYYRELAGRADELVGVTYVNSLTGRGVTH